MTTWVATRTIIEQKEVTATHDAFSKDYPRFGELWTGISWLLARKGHELGIHQIINNIEYRLYVIAAAAESLPEVTVLYTVENDTLTIHNVGIQIGKAEKQPAAIAKVHQNG